LKNILTLFADWGKNYGIYALYREESFTTSELASVWQVDEVSS